MAARKGKLPLNWLSVADAYLRWMHYTDFRYYEYEHDARFGILVELKSRLTTLPKGELIAENYFGERFVTAEIDVKKCDEQLNIIAGLGALRIELATPVATPRALGRGIGVAGQPHHERLIGVIDDGCPFAHADLRVNGHSRVAFLWDQGATATCVKSKKSSYGYGYFFDRDALAKAIRLGTPVGATAPDEDAVYAIAGQHRLRPLASHGAHVLGLAAANIPAKNRISPSRFDVGSGATAPPSWKHESDAQAALGFVQIPKDALDDSSGRWLGRHVLDGIQALIDFAVQSKSRQITINVSYGPQTGPHDGSSLLERAIGDLVTNVKKKHADVDDLFVVVPVGNSYQSRAHAEFHLHEDGGPVMWHVPPDSETPSFLEVWLPSGMSLADVRVAVTSPDGQSLVADAGKIVEPPEKAWQVVSTSTATVGAADQWTVLVALGATGGYRDVPRPPHGRWTVSVKPVRKTATGVAHAYLARNDHNFGGLRRGKPSHFWLESYDPNRFMRSREDDLPPPANDPTPAVSIRSAGTMSGLSTGARSCVAAGYRIADGEPAIYSSGGPSRGNRGGPDYAFPTDESRVFPGVNSWGNRSGASVRLTGTSSAAPQYARSLDDGSIAPPPAGPCPDPRLGWGRK